MRSNTKFMGKPSQQPLQEEDEATLLRRRMDEEINEIKKSIKQEFQHELSNNHTKKQTSSDLILHNFQKELHLLQTINQRQRLALISHSHALTTHMDSQSDKHSEEDTQVPDDQAQFLYTFNKTSYQSATFEFFPLKSEYQAKDIRDKLLGLQEQQTLLETCVVSEEQNHQRLQVSLREVEQEHHRTKQQIEQKEKQLTQFIQQKEETHTIEFQALDSKNETHRTLKEIKKKIHQLEFVEIRYKEKKHQILDELRKDNDFYENTLSKLRLQIQEKQAINKVLEEQLQDIHDKEEIRNKATNDHNVVTDYISTFQKIQKYFLDGEIFHNPQSLEEYKTLSTVDDHHSHANLKDSQKMLRMVASSNKMIKKNIMKSTTFITGLDMLEVEQPQFFVKSSSDKSPTIKKTVHILFSIEDQLTFFKSIDLFVSLYPEGIYLLASNILKEFHEMRNEAGILEILFCFLTKQIQQQTSQLEMMDSELQLCRVTLIGIDPSDQKNDQCSHELATVNLMRGDKQDTNIQVQINQDRKNQSQRFSFQIFLTLFESLNRLCNILMKLQDQSSLIPYEFEKQYQTISVKLTTIKLQPPNRLVRKKHTMGIEDPSEIVNTSIGAQQQIELSNEKIIDTLKDYLFMTIQSLGLQGSMLEDCSTLIKEQVDELKNDYVCKAFVQKDRITKFYSIMQNSLRSHIKQVPDTNYGDLSILLVRYFTQFQHELHSLQQQNIMKLLNMHVQLIKSLCQYKTQLAQKFDQKDIILHAKQKIDKSQAQLRYMNKASQKLQSYFDHVTDASDEVHLRIMQEQLNNSMKERPTTTNNFVKDLELISRTRRKVALKSLHQKGKSTVDFYNHDHIKTDQQHLTEEDCFEQERIKYKTFYEQTSHFSSMEEKHRIKVERFELQQKNLVFNRLTNTTGSSRLLVENREHLRQISKNNEVLFKIKQLNKNSKKLEKETLIQDLNQERLQKEKVFKREFNNIPLQPKNVVTSKVFFQIDSFDDEESKGIVSYTNISPTGKSLKRPSVIQELNFESKKLGHRSSIQVYQSQTEVRPKTQGAKLAQIKILNIKEVQYPAEDDPQQPERVVQVSQESLKKYSIQAMASSPYMKTLTQRVSQRTMSKFFSKEQVITLSQDKSKYNFPIKK